MFNGNEFFGSCIGGETDLNGVMLTDDYGVDNMAYAHKYRKVLTDKIYSWLGYVLLTKLVYFN